VNDVFDSSFSQLPLDVFSLFLAFTAYNIGIKNVNLFRTIRNLDSYSWKW